MVRRLVLVLAASALLATPAHAYRFMGPRWPDATFPIQWRLDVDGADNVTDGTDKTEVIRAATAWTNLPCSKVSFAAPTDLATTAFSQGGDSINKIYWVEGRSWEYGSATLGVTTPIYYTTGEIIDADIQFNGYNYNWTTGRGNYCTNQNGCTDVYSIALHELGHFFGLDHSAKASAVMAPTYPGFPKQDLDQDDVDAACVLYPQPNAGTGQQGSSCTAQADCAQGLSCVRPQNGTAAICTLACPATCPAGYSCQQTSGGSSACFPAANATGDLCKACSAGAECSSGLCIATQEFAYCSRACTSQTGCPTGYQCVNAGSTNICYPQGGTCSNNCSASQPCPTGQECVSGSCRYKTGGEGELCPTGNCGTGLVCVYEDDPNDARCRRECNPGSTTGCPTGQECYGLGDGSGACFPEEQQQTGGRQGDACSSTNRCESGFWCVGFGGTTGTICVQDCRPASGACAGGLKCNAWNGVTPPAGSQGGYCYGTEPPPQADECQACGGGIGCKTGLFCVASASGNFCRRGCSSNATCSSNSCETMGGIPGSSGVCRCGSAPRKGEGEACAATDECSTGMKCVRDAATGGGVCRRSCDGGAIECGPTQVCTAVGSVNVCVPNTTDGPDGGSSDGGSSDEEDEDRPPRGCGCGSAGPAGLAWIAALGLVVRRRRFAAA